MIVLLAFLLNVLPIFFCRFGQLWFALVCCTPKTGYRAFVTTTSQDLIPVSFGFWEIVIGVVVVPIGEV
jgi:hypothetical protein